MAITFEKGTRMKDPLYLKLRSVHRSMKARCYDPNKREYKHYGAKGVTVCDEWQSINGFLETIDSVDGWDRDKFLRGELDLDKDFKMAGNKLYSPDTCCFLERLRNTGYRPSRAREVIGLSPQGETFEFNNQAEFAREHGLDRGNLSKSLREQTLTKGWLFVYKENNK
ncbi:HNH homing endonuclease [Bacillus phage vB_BanH_McCartney]|nr:HNH homing endonuclease [Bacillus phage vB_BanH_McCartney]